MGVLNVTPDSFSDGGRYLDPEAAIRHGLEMIAEGADVVDVGGESTRPGSRPVDATEERRRVLPVIEALAPHVRVSVDTRTRAVAEAAIEAGATMVNDVSASLHEVAAAAGVSWVAMHMRGTPETMQAEPRYDDVVAEVRSFLVERAERALAAGVPEVWIDPGIGFGKDTGHNLELLARLGALVDTGFPVLVGASRKSFLGRLLGSSDAGRPLADQPTPPVAAVDDRVEGSLAVATWAVDAGARMVRVHEVRPTVQAVRLVAA